MKTAGQGEYNPDNIRDLLVLDIPTHFYGDLEFVPLAPTQRSFPLNTQLVSFDIKIHIKSQSMAFNFRGMQAES